MTRACAAHDANVVCCASGARGSIKLCTLLDGQWRACSRAERSYYSRNST